MQQPDDDLNTMDDLTDDEVLRIGRWRHARDHHSAADLFSKALTILMVVYALIVLTVWTSQVSIAILFLFLVALAILGIKQGKEAGKSARELLEDVKNAAHKN